MAHCCSGHDTSEFASGFKLGSVLYWLADAINTVLQFGNRLLSWASSPNKEKST